jgi:dihydroorotase
MKLHIKGGHLIDPANGVDAPQDVFVAAGHIVGIGTAPQGFTANRIIDAQGLTVCPGLIDLSVRLREPGWEYRSTLDSELRAAAAGGVTRVVCPPDTDPVLDEPGLVEMLKHRARQAHSVHVHPLGALTVGLRGDTITEMAQLTEAGCVGFYNADVPLQDTQVLLRALQYAHTFGYTVWFRPADAALSKGGVAASGALASRMGLAGVPEAAESVALLTLFELLRSVPCRVHITRVSTARGVELIRAAKGQGLPITCDVSVHHLHLSDMDIGYFDSAYRFDPPLRSPRDRQALRSGVADGTIDAICSDHTPVDDDAKLLPFAEAEAGASGVETLLSLALKWCVEDKRPVSDAIKRLCVQPARIAAVSGGSLSAGQAADLCIFDPHAVRHIKRGSLFSQSQNTPWLGHELPGQVRICIAAGQIVFEAAV